MSLTNRLASAIGVSLVGTAASQVVALFGSILLARLLGGADFGSVNLIRSTVLMLGALAGAGLGVTATRYVAEHREREPERAGGIISMLFRVATTLGVGAAILTAVLAGPIAAHLFDEPALALPVAVGAVLLLINALKGVQLGVLAGAEAFGLHGLALVLDAALLATGALAGASLAGVTGCVAGLVIAGSIALPFNQALLRRVCARSGIPQRRAVPFDLDLLRRFALPAALVFAAIVPFEWAGRVILARGPDGLAQVGIFAAAYSWGQLVLFVPAQVMKPTMPMLTRLYAADDHAGFRQLFARSLTAALVAALAVALPLMLLSGTIMAAYGDDFIAGGTVLAVNAAAFAVASLTSLNTIYTAAGHMWVQVLQYALWGCALLILLALLRDHGALGFAWAYLGAYVVLFISQLVPLRRVLALPGREAVA